MLIQTSLHGVVPFGDAILVSIVGRAEPGMQEIQQVGEDLAQKGQVFALLVDAQGQAGKDRRRHEPAALPCHAGFPVHSAVFLLREQVVPQQALQERRPAGKQ